MATARRNPKQASLAELGARIRDARRRRNMTQRALAAVLGVTPSYVGLLEKGKRNPSYVVLVSLGRALGLGGAKRLCG